MKLCPQCKKLKELIFFTNDKTRIDGKFPYCKKCKNIQGKKYRDTETTKERYYRLKMKNIRYKKLLIKRLNDSYENKINRKRQIIYNATKHRAKKYNIPFNIDIADIIIPEYCPILNIKIDIESSGKRDNSPSIDKIVPSLGYVKGNIKIISNRANTIKNCGTADEHRKIADYIDKQLSKSHTT